MAEVFFCKGISMNFSFSNLDLSALSKFSAYFAMEDFLNQIPVSLTLLNIGKFFLVFMVITLGISIVGRLLFGGRNNLSHAMETSVSILVVYVVTVVVYILRPWNLDILLSPLPFVSFCAEALVIHPFQATRISVFSSECLSLILLALLVNISTGLLSNDRGLIRWYISHFLAVFLSMLLHLVARWAIIQYCPAVLVDYAPGIMLVLLLTALFTGLIKALFGMFLTIANPIIGILYSFFFASYLGKKISGAVLSSVIVCGAFAALEQLGYRVICISVSDLMSYIPLMLGLAALWYLIGHEL